MNQIIRVIIADDYPILREGLKTLLQKETDIRIIGEAENGRDLLSLVRKEQPAVVMTDIQMPEMDGIEACRIIKEECPRTNVITLTGFSDDHLILDMMEAGASGYLLKNTTREELSEAIRVVSGGGSYFCKTISGKLAKLLIQNRGAVTKKSREPDLSKRELDVVKLLCQQFTSKQIAFSMGISPRTVENYKEKIQEKIDAKNMIGIVLYAIRNNICHP